jgi:hypothetical protein
MRRGVIAGSLALALAAGLAQTAAAGGAVWNFEREYYAPGDRVIGRVTFGRGSGYPIRAEAGPFTAYLLPGGQGIEAPRIPPSAIPVGPMQLSRSQYGDWLARVDFTLPDLPTGTWMLEFCNDPCTVSSLGEITFGWFRVIPSRDVAPVYAARDRLREQLRSLKDNVRNSDRRAEDLAHEVRLLEQEVGRLRYANRQLGEEVAARRSMSERAERLAHRFPAPVGWILVVLTVLFGLVAFRPRRRPLLHPDPPEVERIYDPEREPALRP